MKRSLRSTPDSLVRGGLQRLSLGVKKVQLEYLFRRIDRMPRQPQSSNPHRILLLVFGGLGDSILCETVCHHLKTEFPQRRVEVLTASYLPLFTHMPSVDTVFSASPEMLLNRGWGKGKFWELVRVLASREYREAVEILAMVPLDGLNGAYTGLLLWSTGAAARVGRKGAGKIAWRDAWRKENVILSPVSHTAGVLTHRIDPDLPRTRLMHESFFALQPLGKEFYPLPHHPQLGAVEGIAQIWAEELLKRFSHRGTYPVVGVNLEATYPLKGWPQERFLEVMVNGKREGLRFLLVGLKKTAAAAQIKDRLQDAVLDLSGMTNLEQLMAVVNHCDLFLSGDTGPAHLAQAYQVPTLVLFGPSNYREFGPRAAMHKALVAQRYCGGPPCVMGPSAAPKSCMLNITSAEVLAELVAMARHLRSGVYGRKELPVNTPKEVLVFP